MDSPVPNLRPYYKVGNPEWVAPSPDWLTPDRHLGLSDTVSEVLSIEGLTNLEIDNHGRAALRVFARVYTLAKILLAFFLAYGVELDDAEMGLLYWVKRAERDFQTDSICELVKIVENLFYAVYSRCLLAMAAISLCFQRKADARPTTNPRNFDLPNPLYLYRIFLAMKDALDRPKGTSECICDTLNDQVVFTCMERYVCRMVQKLVDEGFSINDVTGFRQFATEIVANKNHQLMRHWSDINPFFGTIPAALLTVMAEKYLLIDRKETFEYDIPSSELPFIDPEMTDVRLWAIERAKDRLLNTLAATECKFLGELRREEGKPLMLPVRRKKCVCIPLCRCAAECTQLPYRSCPCSESHLRLMMAYERSRPGSFEFAKRTATIARIYFERLTLLQHSTSDGQLVNQLEEAMQGFEMEVTKEHPIFDCSGSHLGPHDLSGCHKCDDTNEEHEKHEYGMSH